MSFQDGKADMPATGFEYNGAVYDPGCGSLPEPEIAVFLSCPLNGQHLYTADLKLAESLILDHLVRDNGLHLIL